MDERSLESHASERDPDLVAQAKEGHGVPSQDPDPNAQHAITADEARHEEKSVYVGGGIVAGAVAGAAVGTAVGGPIGVVVGGTVGAVAGAVGGAAAGALGHDDDDKEEDDKGEDDEGEDNAGEDDDGR